MARLSTTVRDHEGNELFRMEGRQPSCIAIHHARKQAERQSEALRHQDEWTVTTQRGSTPALSYEDIADGA